MSDIWYYADGDKSVGPLSFADLTAVLSRVSNPKDVLVWRIGFEQWKIAQAVPELKASAVRPPPLPASRPLPRDAIRVSDQKVELERPASNSERRNYTGSTVSVVLIVITVVGARYFLNLTGATSHLDPDSLISGTAREAFVSEGITSCLKKQADAPENQSLSLSTETLRRYCSCYMNGLADKVTYGDLRSLPKDGSTASFGPAIQKKITAADASCTDELRRSLLGGG